MFLTPCYFLFLQTATSRLRNKSPIAATTATAGLVQPTGAAHLNGVIRPITMATQTAAYPAAWNPA